VGIDQLFLSGYCYCFVQREKLLMALDEKNCEDKINALTQQDWKPLLDLIPEIENTSRFGEWLGG